MLWSVMSESSWSVMDWDTYKMCMFWSVMRYGLEFVMKLFGFMHVLKRYEGIINRALWIGTSVNMHVLKRYGISVRFRVCDETIWVYACSEALWVNHQALLIGPSRKHACPEALWDTISSLLWWNYLGLCMFWSVMSETSSVVDWGIQKTCMSWSVMGYR